MTITKGVSQGQEFFESHYFSCQNGPKSEFHTYCYKTSAHDYFLENKASLMIFSHFKAKLNYLNDRFCLTLFTISYFTDDSPSRGVVITPPQAKLLLKFFLLEIFSIGGLGVSIADFGFEGPGFDSQ